MIEGQAESQSLDFKADMPWHLNDFAKDFLSMANVRDGGTIIIGVKEIGNIFERQGVSDTNLATYSVDKMKDKLRKYADPTIPFEVKFPVDSAGRKYVAIRIHSFQEIPVLCVVANQEASIKQSTIYYRNSDGRVESGAISNSNDLRELIELAAVRMRQRREAAGFTLIPSDKVLLDMELDGL